MLAEQLVSVTAERDHLQSSLSASVHEREHVYQLLVLAIERAAPLLYESVTTPEAFAVWSSKYVDLRDQIARGLGFALPPHEWLRLSVVEYNPAQYAYQFNQEHGNLWAALNEQVRIMKCFWRNTPLKPFSV